MGFESNEKRWGVQAREYRYSIDKCLLKWRWLVFEQAQVLFSQQVDRHCLVGSIYSTVRADVMC